MSDVRQTLVWNKQIFMCPQRSLYLLDELGEMLGDNSEGSATHGKVIVLLPLSILLVVQLLLPQVYRHHLWDRRQVSRHNTRKRQGSHFPPTWWWSPSDKWSFGSRLKKSSRIYTVTEGVSLRFGCLWQFLTDLAIWCCGMWPACLLDYHTLNVLFLRHDGLWLLPWDPAPIVWK